MSLPLLLLAHCSRSPATKRPSMLMAKLPVAEQAVSTSRYQDIITRGTADGRPTLLTLSDNVLSVHRDGCIDPKRP
jgi:hypothetical protein